MFIPVYANEQIYKTYRIIRTNPKALVSALQIVPTNQADKTTSTTRMARFFRIKNKRVVGKSIDLEVIPDFPLLNEYFADITLLYVHLDEISAEGNNFEFAVTFRVRQDKKILANMAISPHEMGSLLSMTFHQSHYPAWSIKAFLAAASSLGFVAESEAAAVKGTVSDPSYAH
jgi:hypothetical protein